MVTALNILYSKAAIARILGVAVSKIKGFQKWWRVCWVWVEGQRPRLFSLSIFKQHFVDHRKAQAREIYVSRVRGNSFRAVNPKKGSAYDIYALPEGIDCSCEDFSNQIIFLKKGCCKHGYALLKYLGFDSLADYVEQHQWVDSSHPPHENDDINTW